MQAKTSATAHAKKLWTYERKLVQPHSVYAGVDEAGRGALAGPVVAAAVILGGRATDWTGLNDSKQISKLKRERYYEQIMEQAMAVSVGMCSAQEIDELNILHASRRAMGLAIQGLGLEPEIVLADGPYPPIYIDKELPSIPVIDGDAKCLSIAAASIVAKVTRDNMMTEFDTTYPDYGFSRNMGYGTKEHLESLSQIGPTEIHRLTFGPVDRVRQVRLDLSW